MDYPLVVIMSYSILPAAVAGIVKFRQAEASFLPLLFFFFLSLLNEVFSSVLIYNGYSNAVNTNFFLLIEVLLILWQFKCWGLYDAYSVLVPYIIIALMLCWLIVFHKPAHLKLFLPFFRYVSAGLIVIMSMLMVIKLTITYNGHLLRSSIFLFCTGFCVYYSSAVLMEVFLQMGSILSDALRIEIFKAGSLVNLVCNIIYLIAVLWMPMKPRFTTL